MGADPCCEEILLRNVAKLVRVEASTSLQPREQLSVKEARKLLAGTREQPHDALWALLLMLGLRRSEACALTRLDIDFLAGTLRISKSVQRVDGRLQELPTETRRSNRTVPLPSRCLYALAGHHRRLQEVHGAGPGRPWQPTGYVFDTRWGTPLDPATSAACGTSSARTRASAASRCTGSATPACPCCSPSASTRARSWRSSATVPSR